MSLPYIDGLVIPAGGSLSNGVNCDGVFVLRIVMPSGWDKAPLTFQVSPDGTNYSDLFFTQTTVTGFVTYESVIPDVTAGSIVALPTTTGGPINWLKIRSGTRNQPVKQMADRAFRLVMDPGRRPTVLQGPAGPVGPAGSAGPPGVTGPTGTASLKGVIDASNAAAGNIGEVISGSNASGISLTTNLPANLITLHLTPGDWNVGSITTFTPVSTGPNGLSSGITLTSGSLPTDAEITSGAGILNQIWASSMPSGKVQNIPTSLVRVNTSVPKDVFLVVMASFGGGTVTATGYMSARRVR